MKTFAILVLCLKLAVAQVCLTDVGFDRWSDQRTYAVADAQQDFGATKGPYKMIKDGEGSPLTQVEGSSIRGTYRKGMTRRFNCPSHVAALASEASLSSD